MVNNPKVADIARDAKMAAAARESEECVNVGVVR